MSGSMSRRLLGSVCGLIALAVFINISRADERSANNTVYQVFVRSFADSDGDGIGDLKGLILKLDYLNDGNPATDGDLEVGVLWLMPIFPSDDYHGYSVDHYEKVDSEYGTLPDFDALIAAAHQRGMRVILDIPFNHTSNRHPWFEAAINDPDGSPFAKFYHLVIGDEPSGDDWHWVERNGRRIYYWGDFGIKMPDLNLAEPEVRNAVKSTAAFWLNRGVDGFRLDAAKHVFAWRNELTWEEVLKNNAWWKEFSNHVKQTKPEAILVGEVLDSEQTIHHFAYSLEGLLDLHFMDRVRNFAVHRRGGVLDWWRGYLAHARENNGEFDLYPFVASHDENPRLASYLREHAGEGKAEPAYRLAMYLLLTVGKYPVLYNGDEVMQAGWKWKGEPSPAGDGSGIYDETLREPFPWFKSGMGPGQTTWFAPRFDRKDDGISVEEQQNEDGLLSLVRALVNLRAENTPLANGEIRRVLNDNDGWIVFEKGNDQEQFLILINASETGQDYKFHSQWHPEYANAKLEFWSDGRQKKWKDTSSENQHINGSVYVPPTGFVVLKRRD